MSSNTKARQNPTPSIHGSFDSYFYPANCYSWAFCEKTRQLGDDEFVEVNQYILGTFLTLYNYNRSLADSRINVHPLFDHSQPLFFG